MTCAPCGEVTFPNRSTSSSEDSHVRTSVSLDAARAWMASAPAFTGKSLGLFRALGNAVVPAQAREAFKHLMGLTES